MTSFSDLGLAEALLRALSRVGYTAPTPIQANVIPPMRAGRDLIGIAQTGTGKTASFVLPLLDRIATGTAPAPRTKSCGALVLVPTRELAIQVADAVATYGRFLKVRHAVVIGGANAQAQARALKPGVDVVIATPGRLEDHLSTGAIRLNATDRVILDEADQMLDLGFMPAIRRILARLPADRQTVLMSATMPGPIRALAAAFLTDPLEVAVTPPARPIERIDQKVIAVPQAAKRDVLADLMRAPEVERAIVFTRTKRGADRVAKQLGAAGLKADAIHGNKSQGQRQRALAAFRAGRAPILVATDIAARGIDVDGITHVVNFDLPNVPESYVHRIGRTARAGRAGTAISLLDAAERPLLRDIEKLIGMRLDARPHAGTPQAANANAPAANQTRQGQPARRRNGAEGFPRPQPERGDIAMATGSVKWFNSTKGYGFICPDEGGSDVFVHISAVERSGMSTLDEGQRVNYEIEVDKKRGKSSAVNLSAA